MDEDRSGTAIRRDRFSGGPARSFLSSMTDDQRIFAADLAVDRAHVIMLAEQEIIDRNSASEILQALAQVEEAGYDALPVAEDVHEAIESAVIEYAGEAGGSMHTARSRNDEVATCIRYRLRDDVLDAIEATLELREALLACARAERDTVMPGYTHLQPAQATTVGHWALSYADGISRDTARLFAAFSRINHSPLGAAAFAGTPFPIDRSRTASLLGFDSVIENAMDAVSSRDVLLETGGALVALSATISGLAADVILFAHREHVELADEFASTSSIMPQKKNPDSLELVRASAGDAAAGFMGMTTTLTGLPRAYNRDLQRVTPHIWRAIDATIDATDVAAGAIETASWNAEQLGDAAGDGFTTATGVADRLVAAGVPFRTAHEIVAAAAEDADDLDRISREPQALEAALHAAITDKEIAVELDPDEFISLLDPAASVDARDSRGGPAPDAMATQIDRTTATLEADWEALAVHRSALTDAAEHLDREVAAYAW